MLTSYILLPEMEIHNANAMSSTYTIGFPAMTAWLGAVHALQRKMAACDAAFSDLQFTQAAVICHSSDLQVYRSRYRNVIIGTANPLKKKNGSYERPPFIAEARIHLCVSVLIETNGIRPEHRELAETWVNRLLPSLKMASGDIMRAGSAEVMYVDTAQERTYKAVIARLMPGYALIERRDLLQKNSNAASTDGLNSLLDVLAVRCRAEQDERGNIGKWVYERKNGGWIVPISVGFKGLSSLGHVRNQRDPAKDHRFAENIVTLGEFKMPYRFAALDEMMWHYEYDEENGLYICKNQADT